MKAVNASPAKDAIMLDVTPQVPPQRAGCFVRPIRILLELFDESTITVRSKPHVICSSSESPTALLVLCRLSRAISS